MLVSKRANNFMKKLKFRFGSSGQFSVRSSNSTCKSAELAVFGGGAEDLRNDIFVYRVNRVGTSRSCREFMLLSREKRHVHTRTYA